MRNLTDTIKQVTVIVSMFVIAGLISSAIAYSFVGSRLLVQNNSQGSQLKHISNLETSQRVVNTNVLCSSTQMNELEVQEEKFKKFESPNATFLHKIK